MSKFTITYPSGATPLDPDEIRDLIPDYISTMGELNQLEQANIDYTNIEKSRIAATTIGSRIKVAFYKIGGLDR